MLLAFEYTFLNLASIMVWLFLGLLALGAWYEAKRYEKRRKA